MRAAALALALLGCTAAPVRTVPKTPPIPTTGSETWRCVAPGVSVLVVGTAEPRRVEAGGATLDCYLVPLGD